MDALELLKHDHRMVEQLFRDYHAAYSDEQRRGVAELVVRELSKHAALEDLDELGRLLDEAKRVAPTRPHPHAPEEPPALTLAAPLAAAYDRIRDRLQRRPRT
ncbi:hypothetical protein GCM10010218_61340 [Streptomyces mashuensis]|uniref:Hemerythrin-like domain-containing protein n=1 Tax=Streptomyces mashuensis TaxID=33904 RepID=A0A919B9E1_9ACTN|nr:hypothetical protein [Streptomyces mashuensis]GHF71836.1 hypothetical protein GCM10010218_61340 [Streptomyces mashuensis]